MSTENPTPPRNRLTRKAGALLVAAYVVFILIVALSIQPLNRTWLIRIALVPVAQFFIAGIPKVMQVQPRGLMILFHLIVYPLVAFLTLGLPGALIAWQISRMVS